jgi:hypothetical protein
VQAQAASLVCHNMSQLRSTLDFLLYDWLQGEA